MYENVNEEMNNLLSYYRDNPISEEEKQRMAAEVERLKAIAIHLPIEVLGKYDGELICKVTKTEEGEKPTVAVSHTSRPWFLRRWIQRAVNKFRYWKFRREWAKEVSDVVDRRTRVPTGESAETVRRKD